MYRYRVRGPYATAIAKILLDSGAELVDLSRQLSERFSLPQRPDEAPHATIKVSEDDPSMLVVIGYRDAVLYALDQLLSRIPFTLCRLYEYGPYTTLKAKIVGEESGRCIVETPIGKAIALETPCSVGEEVLVHIVRVPTKSNEELVVRYGAAIVKDTVTVIANGRGRVSFSEHIRNFERRAELTMLSQQAVRNGYSVRWRSASKNAPLEKLTKDLEEAIAEISKLRERSDVEGVYSYGESIAFVYLTKPSKEYLDYVRRQVLSTAPLHHTIKTCGMDQSLADTLDFLSGYLDLDKFEKAIEAYIVENMKRLQSVRIKHVKPDGEQFYIGPIYVEKVYEDPVLGYTLIGRRVVKSEGVYDGLGIPKEPGDSISTLVPLNRWFVIHRYTSKDGVEKGMYININTPPEWCPPYGEIRYVDLYVDVVIAQGEVKVIDMDQLEKAWREGIVSDDLVYMVRETVDYILKNIDLVVNSVRSTAQP